MNVHCLFAAMLVTLAPLIAMPTAVGAEAGSQSEFAKELASLVNQYRARHNLGPLVIDQALNALAQEHSTAMARDGRMNHDGMPSRVRRSGWGMCVENVGWNYASARDQLDAWRRSPGHDRNLLDPRVGRMGVGVADGYVTQLACGK